MATKRPDKGHDSTMELSVSQLVVPPSKKPPPQGIRGSAKNDMSTWGQVVVGTDDFAPPTAKPERGGGGTAKWIAVALGVAVAALGGYFVVTSLGGDDKAAPAAPAVTTPTAPAPAPATKPDSAAKPAGSAAVAATTGSAAPAPAAGSATPAPTEGSAAPAVAATTTAEVDAISGVAPIIKKKPVVKKKKRPVRRITKKPAKKTATKRR
jgi:hypothetical protein